MRRPHIPVFYKHPQRCFSGGWLWKLEIYKPRPVPCLDGGWCPTQNTFKIELLISPQVALPTCSPYPSVMSPFTVKPRSLIFYTSANHASPPQHSSPLHSDHLVQATITSHWVIVTLLMGFSASPLCLPQYIHNTAARGS